MVQVVDYDEFSALKRLVEELQADNAFLKSLLLGERWLSRKQAMRALNCGTDKLRTLHLRNAIAYRYEGDKPYYDSSSIRDYLAAQKIDSTEVDKRILSARFED